MTGSLRPINRVVCEVYLKLAYFGDIDECSEQIYLIPVHSVGKYIYIMSNFPVQEEAYKVAEKQSSEKESKKNKLDKIKLPNKLQPNNIPKMRENEQFSVASLLGTSKMTHGIVEITQDSTLGFPKSPSKDLFQESRSTSWPLSKIKCVKVMAAGAGWNIEQLF
uniref:Uncharacterized protein n=1 Tax=Onchocerca volvulus TaxID=6282 RepID=A0A8R1Y4C6_ONCVO